MGSPSNLPRQPTDDAGSPAGQVRVKSAELLQGRQQLEIEHAGEVYRLRLTKTGKLILTK